MPSANIETLYDIETFIEESAKLAYVGIYNLAAYTRKEAACLLKEVKRIELRFRLGEATGHLRVMADGSRRPDRWRGQLTVQVITQPKQNDATHEQVRAQARNLAAQLQQYLNQSDAMPYHEILEVPLDAGTTPILKSDNGFEYSSLVYALLVGIRSDAWPAGT